MGLYNVEITGAGIVDKHTHYEAYPFVGVEKNTVIIRGDIATEFQRRYGLHIRNAGRIQVSVDLRRNDQLVKECQDPFRSGSYLNGAVNSLEDIVYTR